MSHSDEDNIKYIVVINEEEQYSIWPSGKTVPQGWRSIGDERPKAECLEFIERNWKDMRPLSLRNRGLQ
jgi:MbtH protein